MKRPFIATLIRILVAAGLCSVLAPPWAAAKVDLVTLPTRDAVQLTIYNSEDLTLVRETRALTLAKGQNRLQFSWANTLIDPTSLEMLPKAGTPGIEVLDITYPPRVSNLGIWTVASETDATAFFNISYLTSGLSWQAFYLGSLSEDESEMTLKGYVRVENQSGEDYENAQTRLIVGKINLLEGIGRLARQKEPYGQPQKRMADKMDRGRALMAKKALAMEEEAAAPMQAAAPAAPKVIEKKEVSEYFLYTIEGRETLPNGWAKRLPSFSVDAVPVVNFFRYDPERYGETVRRFLKFANDKDHKLGDTPIPGGELRLFRRLDKEGRLGWEGSSRFKYIPVGQKVELDLGDCREVIVEAVPMKLAYDNHMFDNRGDISGYDTKIEVRVTVKNFRSAPALVEVAQNFPETAWGLDPKGEYGKFEKKDLDTVCFTLSLKAGEEKQFFYNLTLFHGQRAEGR